MTENRGMSLINGFPGSEKVLSFSCHSIDSTLSKVDDKWNSLFLFNG